MWTFIIICLISIAVSTLGTVVGFGGAVFLVPILILFFHYPIHLAIGSVMVALVPSSMLSSYFNSRKKTIDYKAGIMLEIPTAIGTVFGALLVAYLPVFRLEMIFAIFVTLVGVSMFKGRKKEIKVKKKKSFFQRLNEVPPSFTIHNKRFHVSYKMSLLMISFWGLSAGTIAGLFGVGGGFMKTPIMIKVFKIPHKIATSTALFMIVITSMTGTVSHYLLGHIKFNESLPIVIGFLIGAIIGKFIDVRIKTIALERLIAVALLLAGAAIIVNAFIH